jgi:hypothetical protein
LAIASTAPGEIAFPEALVAVGRFARFRQGNAHAEGIAELQEGV